LGSFALGPKPLGLEKKVPAVSDASSRPAGSCIIVDMLSSPPGHCCDRAGQTAIALFPPCRFPTPRLLRPIATTSQLGSAIQKIQAESGMGKAPSADAEMPRPCGTRRKRNHHIKLPLEIPTAPHGVGSTLPGPAARPRPRDTVSRPASSEADKTQHRK